VPDCCDTPEVKFNNGNPVCLNCGTYIHDEVRLTLNARQNDDGTFTIVESE
jgi:hypothetical protein